MIKTSATHPLRVDFIAHPALGSRGALGMTFCPGKRGPSSFGGHWERDLDADLARLGQEHRATVLVSLLEPEEQRRLGVRGYGAAARRHGLRLLRLPVADGGVPPLGAMSELVGEINACLDRGERVVVHCRGGLGRAGTTAACVLVRRGVAPEVAVRAVRAARPGAIENDFQVRFVRQFASGPETMDVAAWLKGLDVGPSWRLGGLEIAPLSLRREAADPGYRHAAEAVADGSLEVLERGEGVVQELKARNHGTLPVLILEGDTLVGCKQNRVVTRTVLMGPKTTGVVQVACVEQRRWSFASGRFRAGDTRVDPAVRRDNLRERVGAANGRGFNQGRLWQQVEERLERSGLASSTSDYNLYLQERARELRPRVESFAEAPGQVGAVVVHGRRLVALEAAAHPRLWKALSKRTLITYLLEDGAEPRGEADTPSTWLARITHGRVESSPGLGLGFDFTLRGDAFVGSGLHYDGVLAHVAVFGIE